MLRLTVIFSSMISMTLLMGCVTTNLTDGDSRSVTYDGVFWEIDRTEAFRLAGTHCRRYGSAAELAETRTVGMGEQQLTFRCTDSRASTVLNDQPQAPCPGSYNATTWTDCIGTYTATNGTKYVGEFRDDNFNGQGTLTYPDGNKYVGEFKDDKPHGHGTYTWSNGTQYVGEFRE